MSIVFSLQVVVHVTFMIGQPMSALIGTSTAEGAGEDSKPQDMDESLHVVMARFGTTCSLVLFSSTLDAILTIEMCSKFCG